jgi:acetyl-CoA carboxylase biotin carboxyl carrier protein
MTIEEIKELIRVVHETGIAELEVQRGENRVRIRTGLGVDHEVVLHHADVAAASAGALAQAAPAAVQAAPAQDNEEDVLVKSPIVGTYYDAPSPGAATFVKIGDQVEPGKVLCIIESMKLMNEIEAEIAGVVVAKLVENGRPVEYGEALFTIRPR